MVLAGQGGRPACWGQTVFLREPLADARGSEADARGSETAGGLARLGNPLLTRGAQKRFARGSETAG